MNIKVSATFYYLCTYCYILNTTLCVPSIRFTKKKTFFRWAYSLLGMKGGQLATRITGYHVNVETKQDIGPTLNPSEEHSI